MKKFLFDTWYGAFVLVCGATALLVAEIVLETFLQWKIPRAVSNCVGWPLVSLLLISLAVFFVAWIVSLVKRRWKRAVLQAALGVAWVAGGVCLLGMLLFMTMFGPSEDFFADGLTIPPEVEATIVVPEGGYECSSFSTPDVYDDEFAQSVFKNLSRDGGNDPTVTCDLSALADLVHDRRDELMAYLARHPGWWLHEDGGKLCATRRLRVRGVWNHPLHGYYSGNSCPMGFNDDDDDIGAYEKKTHYQTRTTIGFPFSPFGRRRGAGHPAAATVKVDFGKGSRDTFESCERFGDNDFCVEVFEESAAPERRITNAALSFLKEEFSVFRLPEDAVLRGPEEFTLRNGMQPGIYNLTLRLNPGESGVTYLKAYEVTKGTPLSEGRLSGSSNERIGWSQDPEEKFLYENEFTIYEGDWGKPYAARIEVWFRPDSGESERKLMERVCKIEGWQR